MKKLLQALSGKKEICKSLNYSGRAQNATARLIMDISKFSQITPALYELLLMESNLVLDSSSHF